MDEPKVPVGGTTRYLRLIQKFHPPQKYRYGDEPVHLHAGTFGVDGIYE